MTLGSAGYSFQEGILFPYGAVAGDSLLPGIDDWCTYKIYTPYSIPFRRDTYDGYYVSINKPSFRCKTDLTNHFFM